MESQCIHLQVRIRTSGFGTLTDVIPTKPALIRKCILKLIPVVFVFCRTQNRLYTRGVYLRKTLKCSFYVLLLKLKLCIVTHVLPFASTASTKVLTKRVDSQI